MSTEHPSPDTPASLTGWSNEPSLRQLKTDYEAAKQEADGQIEKIAHWLSQLHITGNAKKSKVEGRSNVQPKLIRKQAEWRYSSLSEPFLSTPDLFNVYPVTFEDKKAAYQNELVLNYQFNTQLNKTKLIDDYVRHAVNEGTVIARVGWEYEEEEVEREVPIYEEEINYDPTFVDLIGQATQAYRQNPEMFAQQFDEETQQSVIRSLEEDEPIMVTITGYETITETVVKTNRPTVNFCDYKDVIPDPSCEGDLSRARFLVYRFVTSKDELNAAGIYQNVDKIQTENNSPLAVEDGREDEINNFNFKDDTRKKFVAYEYWGYWDIHGNGTVQPIVATWVGDTLIRLEENPYPGKRIPFIFVPLLPVTDSLYGEPDGALIEDNQEIVGAVTRGMIDILASNANGQRGVRKDAVDTTNRRKFERGEDFEFNQTVDPDKAFWISKFAEIPVSAQFMLQHQSMDAESFTGVKGFAGSGISGQALGDTATGVRSALDAASKRELGILRRLADGMIQIGRMIVAMNAEFLSDEEIIRVTNEEFVAIKREELAGNFDLRLTISTAEEDNQKAQELAFMLQTTGNSVDFGLTKIILSDICKLRKMPELAKRIEEFEPQPDPIEQQKAQLEMMKLQLEIENLKADLAVKQGNTNLSHAKAEEARSKADLNNLEFVETESGVKQERDLQKQGAQAKANAQLEVVKHTLAQSQGQPSNSQ